MLTDSRLEKLQYLADKYAPATPEITETLAKLQLPPHESVNDSSSVPLPRRGERSQHEVALVIRDGRKVASQLTSLGEASKTTGSTRETSDRFSEDKTSMSTALEQDFTVEGKRGNLQCPFQQSAQQAATDGNNDADAPVDPTPHQSADPICAAMYEETSQSGATGANGANGSKCPIRYMDQHSPEEIAHYVETHKHELPRSHEICVRRYQHNEQQIKKLDSKYGNLVSMIEGLGQLHQPMLPEAEREKLEQEQQEQRRSGDVDKASNERVQNWAKAVTETTDPEAEPQKSEATDGDRQSHFDRPLKEVRVGESPSRPWGIHVPVPEPSAFEDEQPFSPPPAPVRMPSPAQTPKKTGGKCPFDHTKLQAMAAASRPQPDAKQPITPEPPQKEAAFTPGKETAPAQSRSGLGQPAFISPETIKDNSGPQMVFTGPVFIGYPVDQAIQILNQYRPNNP